MKINEIAIKIDEMTIKIDDVTIKSMNNDENH